jgi:hypothetical protein
VTVTVVGDRCVGAVEAGLADQARRLAAAAGVELLSVRFDGPELGSAFLGADPRPDVSAPDLADALLAWLRAGRRRTGRRPGGRGKAAGRGAAGPLA